MKRFVAVVLMLSVVSIAVSASVGIRGTYFSPSDADFKSIYGGGLKYGAEIDFSLTKGLGVWLDVGYFAKTGSLTLSGEETKLTLIPIDAGLRYRFLTGTIVPYLGIAARYNLYKESNVMGNVSASGLGFIGKAGLAIYVAKAFGFDAYLAYSSCKMKPVDFEFNVGGIEFGAGIFF
jgi:hypothetical protein